MSFEHLQNARALELPSREAMLQREYSVEEFWMSNKNLLRNAWVEWEAAEKENLPTLDESLLDKNLREAVALVWQDPSKESVVKDLMHEVAPNVFQFQLFDPERIIQLRRFLDSVENANIPLRPPYGIVLNRHGAMLDRRSQGYLAAPSFQDLYQSLVDQYMRPIGRLLFPEIMGYDGQSFGFSIRYQPTKDTSIRPHTDASSITLNINMNMPDEAFSGSSLDFFDSALHKIISFDFKSGLAVIHRGNVPHTAYPITSGERSNLVLWLFGDHGRLPHPIDQRPDIDPQLRWLLPDDENDGYAPF